MRQGDDTIVEAILKVHSVDLVADPATTSGLFEQVQASSGSEAGDALAPWLAQTTIEQLKTLRPDLVKQIAESKDREIAGLNRRIDELTAAATLSERWLEVRRLLAEYQLPDPELRSGAQSELVSQSFLEALLAADRQSRRQLVAERAELLRAATRLGGQSREGRPISREQGFGLRDDEAPLDSDAFARAVR
jgi:hypothetical protein